MEIFYLLGAILFLFILNIILNLFYKQRRKKLLKQNRDAAQSVIDACDRLDNTLNGPHTYKRYSMIYDINVELSLSLKIVNKDKADKTFSTCQHLVETYLNEFEAFIESKILSESRAGAERLYLKNSSELAGAALIHLNTLGFKEGVKLHDAKYEVIT